MEGRLLSSFFARNAFTIRRLHSLAGLAPLGAYLVVHLLVNSSVFDSPSIYQRNVYQIHNLGASLVFVEWGLIYLPIFFHAALGLAIIRGGRSNTAAYPYPSNICYTLQRVAGLVTLLFIAWHVLHMHGWSHAQWWVQHVAEPLGGAKFRPFNAASTAAIAMQQSRIIPVVYAVGILAGVFHLANGLRTMGITWGVWTVPAAQRRVSVVCALFGSIGVLVGFTAIWGFRTLDPAQARDVEDRMYRARYEAGEIRPQDAYKRAKPLKGPSEKSAKLELAR